MPKKATIVTRPCINCGAAFTTRRASEASKRYCSKACHVAYEAIHGREMARVDTVAFLCQNCGKSFAMRPGDVTEYRRKFGRDRPYCSTKCAGSAKRLTDTQWQISCIQCGQPMPIQRKPGGTVNRQKRLCSTACRSAFRRQRWQEKHADAKPTRRIHRGYVRLIIPGRDGGPSRDVFEHRYIMEQHLGRPLYRNETVHHVRSWDKTNNALDNLELWSSNHGPGGRVTDIVAWCIDMLRTYPEFAREQGYVLNPA